MKPGRILALTLVVFGLIAGLSAWIGTLERTPAGVARVTSDFDHSAPWMLGVVVAGALVSLIVSVRSAVLRAREQKEGLARAAALLAEYRRTHRTVSIDPHGMTLAELNQEAAEKDLDPAQAEFRFGVLQQVWSEP